LNIAKSGTILTNGQVIADTITAAGTLAVTASGDALADGDTFSLFNVQPSGSFAATNLPAPGASANWWTTNNYETLTYNVWPTSTSPTVHHPKEIQLKIPIADLVSGTTNGKAITVASLDTNSVTGATVQVFGSYVVYTPDANEVGNSFGYTVSDGLGGSATGTVTVVPDSVTTGQMTGAITSFTGNQANLTFHAIPNYSYVTERSTNMTDWTGISTNTAGANGVISVIDTFQDLGGTPPSSAYYRLKY
jgi:hypothetical protein